MTVAWTTGSPAPKPKWGPAGRVGGRRSMWCPVKFDPGYYARSERLEIAAAGRAPYRHTARLLHLVARRGRRPDGGQSRSGSANSSSTQ